HAAHARYLDTARHTVDRCSSEYAATRERSPSSPQCDGEGGVVSPFQRGYGPSHSGTLPASPVLPQTSTRSSALNPDCVRSPYNRTPCISNQSPEPVRWSSPPPLHRSSDRLRRPKASTAYSRASAAPPCPSGHR